MAKGPLVPRPPFLPFVVQSHGQAPWHTFVVHTTEGADGVANLQAFFRRQGRGFGTTWTISSKGAMGFNGNLNSITWHVKAHNTDHRGCELGGAHAADSSITWFRRLPQLWALAWLLAWLHKGGHIELRMGEGGVVGHVMVPDNDHTDPGKAFPYGFVLKLARNWSKTGVPAWVQTAIPKHE